MTRFQQGLSASRDIQTFIATTMFLIAALAPCSHAQTYSVLYNFARGVNNGGATPEGGLVQDRQGNLYGTTYNGGSGDAGGVYRLARHGSSWVYTPLYLFSGGADGGAPVAGLTMASNGSFYGTTYSGGTSRGGTVFNLQPPAGICKNFSCYWHETVLYNFTGAADGGSPEANVVLDAAGDLYGTTIYGGVGSGVVYELTRSGNSWSESLPYTFNGGAIGATPSGAVVLDSAGNVYGGTAAFLAGSIYGSVYELSPSGSGWTANAVYVPQGGSEGLGVSGTLLRDSAGNLYGYSGSAGTLNNGAIFELSNTADGWAPTILYTLSTSEAAPGALIMDSAGNFYSTTYSGGAHNMGSVVKLALLNGVWTYSSIHDFGGSDGANPVGKLLLDSSGNIYGTTAGGGTHNYGTIFEITP